MIIDPGTEIQQILYTKLEWDADYGVEYTIQVRLRVRYNDDPTIPVWLDWDDLAILKHFPPTSTASPYYDQNDYTKNYITGSNWEYFTLDTSSSTSPIEYRVIIENIGTRHRWFNFLPVSISENTKGFGPLPYTSHYSEIFNQYVHSINKLYKARLELPLTLQTRTRTTTCYEPLVEKIDEGSGTDSSVVNCSLASSGCVGMSTPSAIRIDGRIPSCTCSVTDPGVTIDVDNGFFSSSRNSSIGEVIGYNGRYLAYLTKSDAITSWSLKSDQPALNAIPPNLRFHVEGNSLGLLGYYTETISITNLEYSSSFPGTTCCWSCCPCFYSDPIARYKESLTYFSNTSCILSNGQTINPPALPAADFNLRIDSYSPVNCANTYCTTGGANTGASFTASYNNLGGGNLYVIVYPQ